MIEGKRAAWSAVERAARDAYGQLLASLAYQFRDLAAAEDALGEALRSALESWPATGVPVSPIGWLRTAAHNRLVGLARHRAVAAREDVVAALAMALEDGEAGHAGTDGARPFGDHRLRLLFVCAHPSIDTEMRVPLMLQTVLGLDAAAIGAAFLIAPATMGQRLVRAKRKIRDAGIPFDVASAEALRDRVASVLEGIYAAYATHGTGDDSDRAVAFEALFLAELLVKLLPEDPEALGLLALLRFSHARRGGARSDEGRFVPLGAQDVLRWDRSGIIEAEETLLRAAALRQPGPFQFEAAIQSAHCQRLFSGSTPWGAIAHLYRALNAIAATAGSLVGEAVALTELGNTGAAHRVLAMVDPALADRYQPYWVAAAHLARAEGDEAARQQCLSKALDLTVDPALRDHLRQA